MKALSLCFAALSLAACSNYTVAPLCNDDNAVLPAGVTGDYTFSVQNEDFTVSTTEIQITGTHGGHVFKSSSLGDDSESRLCQVGGFVIDESFVDIVQGY